MLLSVFLALLLPCVGMVAVFMVYICLIWFAASRSSNQVTQTPEKPVKKEGLSDSDLQKLPKILGNDLVLGTDCAVCLDDIKIDQPVRLIPGCNHGFHQQCADTWLSKNPICPLCRTKLLPELFNPPPEIESPC